MARNLKAVGVTLAMLPVLALLIAWLGPYNIAASAGHPAWLHWFLNMGKTRSIEMHSRNFTPPADLMDVNRVRLGAAHFAGGCAECHGAPGRAINPIYEHMLPMPPDLALRVPQWETRELFWIVRHGLQFTGMPAWSGGDREDELWSMVAFLVVLPELDAEAYLELAAGNMSDAGTAPTSEPVEEVVIEGTARLARTACDRCHDTATAGPTSTLVPRLAGQSVAYLVRSMREYKSGERRSGYMQPVAAALDDRQIAALAQYYSALPSASASVSDAGPPQSSLDEAALIVTGTTREQRIPSCLSCHGGESREDYPELRGQHAAYLAQQLRLWQDGQRDQSAWGEVMAAVASRLSEEQIEALAVWFSSQPHVKAEEE